MVRIALLLAGCIGVGAACAGCDHSSGPPDQRQDADRRETTAAPGAPVPSETAAQGTDGQPSDSGAEPLENEQAITTPDQLIAALVRRNPGFDGRVQMQPISAELLAFAVNDPRVRDISPLAHQRIGALDLSGCDVEDLRPLEGMPLVELHLADNRRIRDLSPLAGMPLGRLNLRNTGVQNLGPLRGMPLAELDLAGCDVGDLGPLAGMPLAKLYLEDNHRLKDLGPLRGLPLQELYLSNTQVEDLSPIHGAPLVQLNAVGARIQDISPLAESPLEMLWLSECPIKDLAPLARTPLVSLTVENTPVDDISPLAGHSIQRLHIAGTAVTDLTPVGRMRLTRLIFSPNKITQGIDVVRKLPIGELGTTFDGRMPPATFWQLYDEGKLP